MWLDTELKAIQTSTLSIRQQLDIIQDNAYIRCNLDSIIGVNNTLRTVDTSNISSDSLHDTDIKEVKLAWKNIRSYLSFLFPRVWKAIDESNIFQDHLLDRNIPIRSKDINRGIKSYKKILEVAKTLVYGGSLRPLFSRDDQIQKLYNILLHSCQISDTPGIQSNSGQNRVLFLQDWLEKLVAKNSLSTYLANQIVYNSPKIITKAEPAQVTVDNSNILNKRKYIISKIPISGINPPSNKHLKTSSHSSASIDTTFSTYLNSKSLQPPKFIGLKLKFNSDSSESGYSTEDSNNSVWKPVFGKDISTQGNIASNKSSTKGF